MAETRDPRTDEQIGADAEKEAEASLKVIRALKPLDGAGRGRVMESLVHLMAADQLTPGIIAQFLKGATTHAE